MEFVTPEFGMIFWTILFVVSMLFPILSLISILRNRFKDNDKLIWILVVLFMPLIGSILYFVMGRPSNKRNKIRNSNKHFIEF